MKKLALKRKLSHMESAIIVHKTTKKLGIKSPGIEANILYPMGDIKLRSKRRYIHITYLSVQRSTNKLLPK
jgi:hypothetical protein